MEKYKKIHGKLHVLWDKYMYYDGGLSISSLLRAASQIAGLGPFIVPNADTHLDYVLLGGDFNCGNVEWSTMQVPEGVPQRHVQCQLLGVIKDH